jgi:putative Mg2+ transporter-C (MgtC) family protein
MGQKKDVAGLTTAASIWTTAAIGAAAGMGREATAVLSTILALAILSLIPMIARLVGYSKRKSETMSE